MNRLPVHDHSRVELSLLGGFSAVLAGTTPACRLRISSRKGRALLAYLAMNPGHRHREQLASLLWGDRQDGQARQSLRQCLVLLRRELQPYSPKLLVLDGELVALDPQCFEADAPTFAALVELPDNAGVLRAAELYGGEFLAGFDFEVDPFDQWLREQRARFASLAARAFAAAVGQMEATGDGAGAIAMAERFVRLDPLQEDAQHRLLRLYARYRGRDAALAHAKSIVSLLRSELDADPAPETLALIEDVRRGTFATEYAQSASAISAAEMVPRAERSGAAAPEPPVWRRHRSRILSSQYAWAAFVVLLPILALSWFAPERASFVQLAAQGFGPEAAETSSEPKAAWQSPPIFPRPSPDMDALADRGILALVVLPFTSEAGTAGEQIADRITDDLINDLSRISAIRVIARQTSRIYRDQPIDVAAIGSELGVHYAVEGSVRTLDNTVRVNVALVDPATRLQVWSDRFERDRADQTVVQDEIVRSLARRLQVNLVASENRRRQGDDAEDHSNAAQLAKGWGIIFRSQRTGTIKGADKFFAAVLQRDPDNVSALVGLAAFHINNVAMMFVPEREPSLGEAETLLQRARARNPDSHAVHYFLGVLRRIRGELEEALIDFARALELNPSLAPAYAQVGHVLNRLGRPDEALKHINYAMRLSPKDPVLGVWLTFGGIAELNRGNDRSAFDWLTDALSMNPRNPLAHFGLAAAHALQGDLTAAERHVRQIKALAPAHSDQSLLQWIIGPGGESTHDQRFLRGMRIALGAGS